jgi:hypothetical protein
LKHVNFGRFAQLCGHWAYWAQENAKLRAEFDE